MSTENTFGKNDRDSLQEILDRLESSNESDKFINVECADPDVDITINKKERVMHIENFSTLTRSEFKLNAKGEVILDTAAVFWTEGNGMRNCDNQQMVAAHKVAAETADWDKTLLGDN